MSLLFSKIYIYNLQLGIAGILRIAMRLPDNTGGARIFVCGGGVHLADATSLASVVHTFEVVAGRWWSGSAVNAPPVSRVMGGATERNKNCKKLVKRHLGEGFCRCCHPQIHDIIYTLLLRSVVSTTISTI